MAAITWLHVVAHASTLAGVHVDQQADLLDLVNTQLNASMFGGEDAAKTKLARIYFAAHFASLPGAGTLPDGSAAAGPVTSESTGGVSRAYAAITAGGGSDADNWGETIWGRRYKTLLRGSIARFPRVP